LHGFDVRSVLAESPFQPEEAFDLGHGMLEPPVICQCSLLAWMLGRNLTLDAVREEFLGDDQANRLRSRAARERWCL
jgi:hypothetical protein